MTLYRGAKGIAFGLWAGFSAGRLALQGGYSPVDVSYGRLLSGLSIMILLGGCAVAGAKDGGPPKGARPPMVGLANPASVYCQERGGTLEMKEDAQAGQYALCHLPDGRVIEEWAFFRQEHKSRS